MLYFSPALATLAIFVITSRKITSSHAYVYVSPQSGNEDRIRTPEASVVKDDFFDEYDDDDDMVPQARIVGGQLALNSDFPWYVQGYGCGGTLVWPDVVLTAAHCTNAFDDGQVLVGAVRNKRETLGSEWVQITSSLQVHPDFDWVAATNDFMMFSIAPITNSRLLRRLDRSGVALNDDSDAPRDGEELTVLGFGYTQENGQEPKRLLKTNVTNFPTSECRTSYPSVFDPSVMLCAGTHDGSADTCDGDSGGPTVVVRSDGSDLLVGITSWGIGCAREEFPGVYARVSSRLPWIRENLCSLSSDPPDYCAE
jgi:secreted trypsin-like serine protease